MITKNLRQLSSNFLPISYGIFLLGFFFFPSTKSHSNFFYIAVALPFLLLIFMQKANLASLFRSRTFVLAIIYLVYMFCTLFWADSFGINDLSKYGRRVLYVIIFVTITIYVTRNDQNYLSKLLPLICWISGLVAIITIVIFYIENPFPSTRLFGYGLLSTPFKASSIYGITIVVCTYIILHQHSSSMRLAYLGLLLVSFSYVLLAQSRSALLSLLAAMVAWRVLAWPSQEEDRGSQHKRLLIVLVVIIGISAVLFMAYPGYFDKAFLRGYSPFRLKLWGKLLTRIFDAPWFGHGLTADPRSEISSGRILVHPHSVFIGTLLYGGVVGLLLFIAVVVSALWQGFGRGRQSINLAAATMVLYGTLCISLNGNMLIHHPKPFWLFFWFPAGLVVASEIPGHPLHSDSRTPSGRNETSPALAPK